jgi:Undecaprenyl-phosphate galactose phosphotransferase WbaP
VLERGATSITTPAKDVVEHTAQSVVLPGGQVRIGKQWLVILTLIFSDILLASLFWGGAFFLRNIWGLQQAFHAEATIAYIAGNTAVWIGMRVLLGLYPGYGLSPVEELRRQTYATVATLAITIIFAFGLQGGDQISRLLVTFNFLAQLCFAPLGRHFVKWGLAKMGSWGKPVVILGAGQTGRQLLRTLNKEWGLGLTPVSVSDFRLSSGGGALEGVRHEESVADAVRLAKNQKVDTIIFAMPQVRLEYVARFVHAASRHFRHVLVVPNLTGITTSIVSGRDLAGTFAVEIKHNLLDSWALAAKRILDLLAVTVGGLLASPIVLVIAIMIKLDSPGPVLYKHMRLCAEGRHFRCWKFRTMHTNASELLTELLQDNPDLREEWEKGHKLREDPRITRVGSFLRKTSLDELPQLWNVLRGDMSLVGPRPIVDVEISKYGETYELYQRVGPGMTGLWQVSGRSATSYEERVALDAYYVRNWSVWLDLIILARTVKILIFRAGAY